jgi:hypothetical protein
MSVIRQAEKFLVDKKAESIMVECANDVDLFILNHKRKLIANLESSYESFIEVVRGPSLKGDECVITNKDQKQAFDKNDPRFEQDVCGRPENKADTNCKKSVMSGNQQTDQGEVRQSAHGQTGGPRRDGGIASEKRNWLQRIFR